MYSDPERQKKANREAQKRFKAKQKGITQEGITSQGITELPREVLDEIERISRSPEEKQRRLGIARDYQRLYPYRGVMNPEFTDREFCILMAGA